MSQPTDKLARSLADNWCHLLDRVARCDECESSEQRRLARIQCGFALLGFVFGSTYVVFFAAVQFWTAVGIILFCTLAIGAAIPMMRMGKPISFTGNWLTGVLVFGFTGMTIVEGGVTAHAAAWLGSAPLVGLMMISSRAAWYWAGISLAILTTFFALELLFGVHFTPLYAAKWHTLVAGLGFLGLGPFLFAIALTFELTRSRAVAAKELALQELAGANDSLKKLNEEKDQFLSIAAHDLRNPLGLIDAYAQMLDMREDLDEDMREQLGAILKSSKRMANILDDLLNLNAIEQGHYPLHNAVHDLTGVAKECVERANFTAQSKLTTVKLEHDGANEALLDAQALGQVLDNLISNAVKYSPQNSTIRVVSRQEGRESIIEVIDQGPGFTEEDRTKLFQRFAKLSARPTGGESSTGLGLSIVKRITEAMDGRVECHRAEPIGSRFQLVFQTAELAAKPSKEKA